MTMNRNGFDRRTMLRGGALGVLAAPALIGKGIAAGEVTWRVQSHWPKASGSFNDSLGKLAELTAERTDGRMTMELFGAGEFAKGPEIFNIVSKGVVQMGTSSASYMESYGTCASFAYGLPGTLRNSWEIMHLLKNLGVEKMFADEILEEGVIYASEKVYPTELVLSKEVKSVDDFKSLKLRSSGAMLDYLSAAGASASYIAGSELYQALSSGVVDGAHWGAAIGAKSMSLWEVCKYHMKPPLGFSADAWIFNADAVEDLPDDIRLIFTSLVEERFYLRSVEYLEGEAQSLTDGVQNEGVMVTQFPDDVLALFAQASGDILAREAEKSEKAAACADALT
ncbi:MAG: TRAP transporter substrate-binding protein DctP, partial [Pseudomonadota bacterium]|nr:TRAP transporter substrate-binding protein DctP [Pseudomonadota bacterium]